MSLSFFRNTPFNSGTKLTLVDQYQSNGVTTSYALLNKTGAEMGDSLQIAADIELRNLGGFTVDVIHNSFTLDSVPSINQYIVVPGVNYLPVTAFDTQVTGYSNAQQVQVPFWLGDAETIGIYEHYPLSVNPGIMLTVVDLASAGAPQSWFQLADSVDGGAASTFQASGTPLYTPGFYLSTTLAASAASGATSITVASASGFLVGDYIDLNYSFGTEEIIQILGIVGNVMTISGLENAHASGEYVYDALRKFWIQMTIPDDVTGGSPLTYWNIALNKVGQSQTRT